MITLPLSLLVGLLLGIVLSRFVPEPSDKSAQRLSERLRYSLVPLLSLTLGLWLPASLCIYQEAPDWFLMYLVSPDRATPTLLAGLFTLLTLSLPIGLIGMLMAEDARSPVLGPARSPALGQLGPTLGLLAVLLLSLAGLMRWGADRLGWVGSFADFHDGRWLLAALGSGTPRLTGVLLITNLFVLIGVLAAGRAIAGRSSARPSNSERSASGQTPPRVAA